MPRKPVRGRFLIVVPLRGGASLSVESRKDKSCSASEIVAALREYADIIEGYGDPDAAAALARAEQP